LLFLEENKGPLMSTVDSGDKPTILVVDDTPDNLTLVSNLLKKDYRVRVAINGEKALKIAFSGYATGSDSAGCHDARHGWI
jgi:putative two-component system response regulator